VATDRSRRRTLTLSVAALLTLIVLYLTTGVGNGLRSGANLIVTPFSWAVNGIARPIGHFLAGSVNYSDVVAQNHKLRYELGRAEQRANQTWALERQLEQLTATAHVPFVGSIPTVTAQVIADSPTNFSATIGISKGRDQGILVGMPVVANGGLIGRVIATTPGGATVDLITDPASVVGGVLAKGSTHVFVTGRGVDAGLSSASVPLGSGVTPGEQVATDGLRGGLFPPGIPIASVSHVTLTPGAATYNLSLEPDANLRHLDYVDVVLWEPTP
jgi:rod shape-determining protein MreC